MRTQTLFKLLNFIKAMNSMLTSKTDEKWPTVTFTAVGNACICLSHLKLRATFFV